MYETYSTELCHHGILGQRWGKKNGPPYPLDAGDHSASEKKAGWKKSLSEERSKIKSMSNEELRQKVYRKNLERQYKHYSSKIGDSRTVNDALDVTKKGFRTAGGVANALSKGLQFKNQPKLDNIDDTPSEVMSKKEKRRAKREINRAKTITDAVGQTSNETANMLQKGKRVSLDKTDLSKLSDAELKKRVDRLALEAQYEDAFGVNTGKDRAEMALDAIGAVTSVATTALGIAMLVRDLKKD